jgi:hypothetical protein
VDTAAEVFTDVGVGLRDGFQASPDCLADG